MIKLTRREVIDSIVATAALAAIRNPLTAVAQPADQESQKERGLLLNAAEFQAFREFIRISSALTGITGSLLAPASKPAKDKNGQPIVIAADPTQAVKMAYFDLARSDAAYQHLHDEFRNLVGSDQADGPALNAAASKLLNSTTLGVEELARSIIMAWYFGVWYEWNVKDEKPRFTIVSADAYTQGWAWRIVEAHPAGYSNMRFGHWAFEPPPAFKPDAIIQTGDEV